MSQIIALRRYVENLLQTGTDKSRFGRAAGYHFERINTIHPFCEGNGRTQRILFDQIAEQAGFVFEWAAISGDAMGQACREARTSDNGSSKLRRMLELNILTLAEAEERGRR